MANIDSVEQDWREIMALKASKWNKRSRRLSHLTISTHSPTRRSRSPPDEMEDVEMDDSSWSETESSVSTGFSRSVRSRATTLSVYSGIFCDSREELGFDGRESTRDDTSSVITVDDDDDVSTTSEIPVPLEDDYSSAETRSLSRKWIEDDSGLRVFPTKHVDYLSHDWQEVDIWASWRHLMSKKHSYNNEKRLENACWRVWGKKRYDLKTVSPESLNWLKDCDVTWLYGPLQSGPIESLKALALEDQPPPSARRQARAESLELKPILKRRSVSEKMLVRSLLSASLLKQATAAVVAARSARGRSLPPLPLRDTFAHYKIVRPTSPALSRCSSTDSLRPLMTPDVPDKKRIHFQEQVEQCIALENSESDPDSRMVSDIESDLEGGIMTMRRPFSRTPRRTSRSAERKTRIIAKLPSTTLNCADEDADLVNSRSWSKGSPPLPPSPHTSSPSLSAETFMLDDEEYVSRWTLQSIEEPMPFLQENSSWKSSLPFPCLACKDTARTNVDQGKIFESRNDWLVHLWTVHQDPSTWVPTTCLWEGCRSNHQLQYGSASSWLSHVQVVHHCGRQHKRQKMESWDTESELPPRTVAKDIDIQGGDLSRTVFNALATAKDLGSFLLNFAGEPLAVHLEWLSQRSKAREASKNEAPANFASLPPNETQYFRNLARRILGIPIQSQASPKEALDPDQESLVEQLAETLSLYEVDLSDERSISDLDQSTELSRNSSVDKQKSENAKTSALYSMLISLRQIIIQIDPPSNTQSLCDKPLPDLPEESHGTNPPSDSHSDTQLIVLPIRNLPAPEEMDIPCESDEEETTDYDSHDDIPSDTSVCDEPHDASEETSLGHDILEPMREALVDRVMDEFWIIFDQNWNSGYREHGSGARISSSPSNASLATSAANTPLSSKPAQRKRQRDEDHESEDEDGNMSRKPKRGSGPSDDVGDRKRFACPFRKHDSRRYSTYSYRVCALSHWETIARVKEHIYRCHRMPTHCKRCWKPFKNQEQLDVHLTVDIAAMCTLVPGNAPEGITTDQERRLRSRKKSSRDQSDEGRWREMYQLLFPGEEVPSPYFEPIQDEMPGSPDSRDLANYEDYMRRELPRLVRTNIQDAVRRDMQPLEAALIGNLVGIIQDCQDRLFRGYRQSRGEGTEASASPMDLASASSSSGPNQNPLPSSNDLHQQSQLLAAAFQPPPPASDLDANISLEEHQQGMPDLRHQPSLDMILSDSGYASELPYFCDCPGPACKCLVTSDTRPVEENLFDSTFAFDESAVDTNGMQWDGWDPFPTWDSMNPPAFGQ